jgi:hypothetical protein
LLPEKKFFNNLALIRAALTAFKDLRGTLGTRKAGDWLADNVTKQLA